VRRFSTINLTGFNAASPYDSYSLFPTNNFRNDVATQTKANFPSIASTTWLGTTTGTPQPIDKWCANECYERAHLHRYYDKLDSWVTNANCSNFASRFWSKPNVTASVVLLEMEK
jgi:hypothetical protein